jgi:hypothetical protein
MILIAGTVPCIETISGNTAIDSFFLSEGGKEQKVPVNFVVVVEQYTIIMRSDANIHIAHWQLLFEVAVLQEEYLPRINL